MVAEDDDGHATLIGRALRDLAAEAGRVLAVERAEDGELALERLRAPGPACDLLLLDLRMPRLDGLEVLGRLRGGGNRSPAAATRIVVLTTSDTASERAAAMAAGADAYRVKPCGVAGFRDVLREELASLGRAAEDDPP